MSASVTSSPVASGLGALRSMTPSFGTTASSTTVGRSPSCGREPPSARACLAELVGIALVFPFGDRGARILGLLGFLGLLRLEIPGGGLLRIDAIGGIGRRAGRARGPGIGRPSGVGYALVVGQERGVGLVRWQLGPAGRRLKGRIAIEDLRRCRGRRQRQPGARCGESPNQSQIDRCG